jgi:hypothetical protein
MGPVLGLKQGFRSIIFYLVDLNLPKNAIRLNIPINIIIIKIINSAFDNKILELMRLIAKPMPYNTDTLFTCHP